MVHLLGISEARGSLKRILDQKQSNLKDVFADALDKEALKRYNARWVTQPTHM